MAPVSHKRRTLYDTKYIKEAEISLNDLIDSISDIIPDSAIELKKKDDPIIINDPFNRLKIMQAIPVEDSYQISVIINGFEESLLRVLVSQLISRRLKRTNY